MMRRKTDNLEKSKRIKLLTVLSYGTLILAFGFIALISYWMYRPYRILDIKGTPQITAIVTQGEDTCYEISYCKWDDPKVTTRIDFVDGLIYQSEPPVSPLLKGCHTILAPLHIPSNLPPGEYLVRIQATYQVNPIREIEVVVETNKFRVEAK